MKTSQNALMALVGLIVKTVFVVYRAAALLAAAAAAAYFVALGWLAWSPARHPFLRYLLPVLLLGLALAAVKPRRPKDNPHRRYPGPFGPINRCADAFIAWIGTIKYFTSPLSLVEDPGSCKITGAEIRELIDGGLQPGDILLRGYDGYLDGIMISMTGGGRGPGSYFSHAAFYLGESTDPEDRKIAARRLQTQDDQGAWRPASPAEMDAIRDDPRYFRAGRQMVVHSMTRGVFTEDILTFLRCDYLAVLRLPGAFTLSPEDLERDRSLIRQLPDDAEAVRAALMRGGSVTRGQVVGIARLSALGKIGSCYDFQFNDIKTANRFSCSEFVYYCYKSIHCYIGLVPKPHGFLKNLLFRRVTITPADIYDAAVSAKKLEIVWTSGSLPRN